MIRYKMLGGKDRIMIPKDDQCRMTGSTCDFFLSL